ncbi:hypothetical protein GV819_15775 [Pseudomonas sp. Fl5BN2]|uniref:hypothetical protein n=1 Tax=Pseudomonas sp. Fl5BN2 TaxID=2697652 RepID=UPI00137711AC|nr:hypothetical protein [Pseudomonas sp. Fl5BN2]NBF03752.1 hypothetical protein [Pseudomonas sp. Fl5BN2]
MKLSNEEQYFFHCMYFNDFEAALDSLRLIKRYRRVDTKAALLRDLTVAYIRPFSKNKGRGGSKSELDMKVVPAHLRGLHKKLYELRNQQFAHTDLNYYNPKSITYGDTSGGLVYAGFSYEGLLEKLPEIKELVEAVKRVVDARIQEYESAGFDLKHTAAIKVDPVKAALLGLL